MNDLRSSILTDMRCVLSVEQMQRLEVVIDIHFNDFDITRKCRELATVDDNNDIIVKNFLGTKKLSGCSDNTIEYYRYTLLDLLRHLNKNIIDVQTNDIRYYLAKCQMERNLSLVSLNNMRRCYSSFFGWLEVEEYITKNPMKKIEAFKVPKKQIHPFTSDELEELYIHCKSVRDTALLHFLYSTGARVTECVDVNLADIDLIKGEVIIRHGKGDKERKVYLSDITILWLQKYLKTRNDNESALWVGKRGRLSSRGVEHIIKQIAKEARVDAAYPHRFRHTLASDLIKMGAPVQYVQYILGHTSLNTTMIYVTLQDNDIRNLHKRLVA